MKVFNIILLISVQLIFVACNIHDMTTESLFHEVQISAAISPSVVTKVTEDGTEFSDSDAIGVKNLSRNSMNMSTYTYSAETAKWEAVDKLYWEGDYDNTFHAWYPATAAYESFCIPADQTSGTSEADWMTATALAKRADGKLKLSFNHNLVKVTIRVGKWSNSYDENEKIINMLEVRSASSVMSYDGSLSGNMVSKWVKTYAPSPASSFIAIIAPGKYDAGMEIMQIYVNGSDTPLKVKTESAIAVESGKAYDFQLAIGKDLATISSSVSVREWDNELLENQQAIPTMPQPEENYWSGKKMVWNGDSISYGSWLSSPTKDAYPYLVGNALGMDVYNFAIGGSYAAKPKGAFETFYWDYNKWQQDVAAGLVDTSKKYLVKDYNNSAKPCRIYYYDGKTWKANSETGGWAIVERMKEMVALHPDADLIGIAVGTNDFYTSACPFGSVEEAIDERIEELRQRYEYDESVNMIELGEMHAGMKLLATSYTTDEAPEYTVCKDIPIVPGCEYRVKGGYRSWFLDADKTALSTVNLKDQSFRFVAPEGARYISITLSGDISNAYVHGAISDVEKDLTHSTFCGALHTICKYLQSSYEGKDIVFVTPIERYQSWCNKPETPNSLGYTLKDYTNAIIEICSYYSIPVIDFYRTVGVNPHVDKSLFGDTDGKYVHPNEEGHRIMASVVIDYLKEYR